MTASQHYSPQQIAAWAQIDESRWKEKLAKSQVRVAVINAQPVGFITCIGHYIDMLFVEPEYTRRGVASALLKPLIKSESELTVDASITAKPFFERYGFQTVKQQRVECRERGLLIFICDIIHATLNPACNENNARLVCARFLFHKLQGGKS